MEDENKANSVDQGSGVDLLLGVRVFLLTFTIAGILGSAVTVSWWARLILENWRTLTHSVRDAVGGMFEAFGIHLSWDTRQMIPTTLVMISVLVIGMTRVARSGGVWVKPKPTAQVLALLLGLLLNDMSVTYAPAPGTPTAAIQARERCPPIRRFVQLCKRGEEPLPNNSVVDWIVGGIGILAFVLVGIGYPYEFLGAVLFACLFLALGMIDLRPLMGPP